MQVTCFDYSVILCYALEGKKLSTYIPSNQSTPLRSNKH